jgi:hypothetical protein
VRRFAARQQKETKMCENTETSRNWWDTAEGLASIRSDCLRHLVWGLTHADLDRALAESELGSAQSALLVGVSSLRKELLAWAEGQLEQ